MIIKIMSDEAGFDDRPTKDCLIISGVTSAKYYKNVATKECFLTVTYDRLVEGLDKEDFVLKANAYLMNDSGKTIQSFAPPNAVDWD